VPINVGKGVQPQALFLIAVQLLMVEKRGEKEQEQRENPLLFSIIDKSTKDILI